MVMKRIEVSQELDETGEPEQFTWDLWAVVNPDLTLHLDGEGLPKAGTQIRLGMILVGKLAKTHQFDPDFRPGVLDVHALPFKELHEKFGYMWKNSSFYATKAHCGTVRKAWLSGAPGNLKAIIEIEPHVT
jgi:hypothetical protein